MSLGDASLGSPRTVASAPRSRPCNLLWRRSTQASSPDGFAARVRRASSISPTSNVVGPSRSQPPSVSPGSTSSPSASGKMTTTVSGPELATRTPSSSRSSSPDQVSSRTRTRPSGSRTGFNVELSSAGSPWRMRSSSGSSSSANSASTRACAHSTVSFVLHGTTNTSYKKAGGGSAHETRLRSDPRAHTFSSGKRELSVGMSRRGSSSRWS